MVREMMQRVPSTTDQALEAIGLHRGGRSNGTSSLIGMFALGLAVGAGLTLVLVPIAKSMTENEAEAEEDEPASA